MKPKGSGDVVIVECGGNVEDLPGCKLVYIWHVVIVMVKRAKACVKSIGIVLLERNSSGAEFLWAVVSTVPGLCSGWA